jgi:hypothetical protein
MILIDFEAKFIPILLQQLKTIPGVVQVRCNHPLRKKFTDLVGEDGIYIQCMVRKKDGSDYFVAFEDYYTFAEAEDPSKHESIIASISKEIYDYLHNDIYPEYMYEKNHYEQRYGHYIFFDLIEKMKQISNVVSVRYYSPIKRAEVDMIGADGFVITAYVAHKEYPDSFVPFITMAPYQVCYNVDKHDSLVQHLKTRIEDYIERDVAPPNKLSTDEVQTVQV